MDDFPRIRVHYRDKVLFVLLSTTQKSAQRRETLIPVDARRGCHAPKSAQKAALAEGGVSPGSGRRIRLSIHQRRSGAPRRLHVTEVTCCHSKQDSRQGKLTNLLCEGLYAWVILNDILALKKLLGGYLWLSAFREFNNAFNTPNAFGAVKCHDCVEGITAVRLPRYQRMPLSINGASGTYPEVTSMN